MKFTAFTISALAALLPAFVFAAPVDTQADSAALARRGADAWLLVTPGPDVKISATGKSVDHVKKEGDKFKMHFEGGEKVNAGFKFELLVEAPGVGKQASNSNGPERWLGQAAALDITVRDYTSYKGEKKKALTAGLPMVRGINLQCRNA